MRNNLQNDVKVENARNYTSKFNLSGSVSTTMGIGRVGVCFSRMLQPNTEAMCMPETLVQMSPLVSPCYANQHYKQWHQFVPIEDVFPNYSALMTGKSISRNGTVINPSEMPKIRAGYLAQWVLNGAKCSIWMRQLNQPSQSAPSYDSVNPTDGKYFISDDLSATISLGNNLTTTYSNLINAALQGIAYTHRSDGSPTFCVGSSDTTLPVKSPEGGVVLESGNYDAKSFIKVTSSRSSFASEELGYDVNSYVRLESADLVLYHVVSLSVVGVEIPVKFAVAYAFRLSSWGQSFYKLLRGLGYPVDLDNNDYYSVLPLLATYKAYWDIFGLSLWQNFESTFCGRLISVIENLPSCDLATSSYASSTFVYFITQELGAMWVTEQNDYISAHLPQPVVGAPNETPLFGVVDVQAGGGGYHNEPRASIFPGGDSNSPIAGQPSDISSSGLADGHAYTRRIQHGALDSEILKRLYKATNRQTALGQKIAALMRAQGLGVYMERTRVNYIGDFDVKLEVSAVTSQSDTFDSASKDGRLLGSRAGKGIGYGKRNRKLYYKTDCLGWWICIDAVTVDSGYSQGVDATLKAITKEQMYQPDYDGLGLKIDKADILAGTRDICLGHFNADIVGKKSPADKSWGYSTRYSEFKIGRNVINGGFALRSQRDYFLTYNMDKLMFVDDLISFPLVNESTEHTDFVKLARKLTTDDIPVAGNVWRFLNRYPWLANLSRIFAQTGDTLPYTMFGVGPLADLAKYWEYHYIVDDDYIVQNEIWFKSWSPMLPIEETYGTIDPDKKELEYVERS